MTSLVLSLGGSILFSENSTNEYLQQLAGILKEVSTNHHLFVIVGGGRIARDYIQKGRALGFHEQHLDDLGIAVTQVNARFLLHLLHIQQECIPTTINEAASIKHSLVVMGGTTPGHSTDYVGAELAGTVHAERFIIATNVNGVYDKDPNKYKDAVLLPEISTDQLIKQYGTSWESAGKNMVIDGPALQMIQNHKIPTSVVHGAHLDQLECALLGRSFEGTTILFG